MNLSLRYQVFLGLCLVLLLLNLFVMNESTTLWNGAESSLLWEILQGQQKELPHFLLFDLVPQGPLNLFAIRSIGPGLLLLAMLGYYYYGHKIFGKAFVLNVLVVLGASFLIPSLAKRATGDLYLFTAQLLLFISLIRYLKQAIWQWQVAHFIALGLSIWLQPIGSILFVLATTGFLYWKHPNGKVLVDLNSWLVLPILVLGFYFGGYLRWTSPIFEFGWGSAAYRKYLLWNFFGILPFIGLLLGGFKETYMKFRKGEELATINLALGIGALISQSLVLQLLFAVLIAKQLQLYFVKNYPNESLVKAGAVIHLIVVFAVAFFLMMGGMFQFGGMGFRTGLALGTVYWILSFISVIGLYGKIKRLVVGGVLLSGLLASRIFWAQVYPLIEAQRNIPERFEEWLTERSSTSDQTLQIYYPSDVPFTNLAVYGKSKFKQVELVHSLDAVHTAKIQFPAIIQGKGMQNQDLQVQVDTLSGWNDRFMGLNYYLVRNSKSSTLENKIEQNQED